MSEILSFSLIALLLVISPGPNGVLILKTATASGRKAGIANILGLTTATYIHGTLSILGISAILVKSSELFLLVKLIGALYLCYIGIKAIISTFKNSSLVNQAKEPETKINAKKCNGIMHYFFEGFLTQILNPKVSMFYLAAFPQFISFDAASYSEAFGLVSIHALIIFCWFLFVVFMIDSIKKASRNARFSHWVQRTSGAILIYFGGLLITQDMTKR